MQTTTHRTTLETLIKINDKIFTIINKIPGRFAEAVCPRGRRCWIDFTSMNIMHRDAMGRVQAEPFTFN